MASTTSPSTYTSPPLNTALPNDINPSLGTQGQGSPQQLNWQQIQQLVTPPPLPPSPQTPTTAAPSSPAVSPAAPPAPTASNEDADQDQTQPSTNQTLLADLEAQEQQTLDELKDKQASSSKLDTAQFQQYQEDVSEAEQEKKQVLQAELATLQQPPPAPPTQNANPLQRMAPLLMLAAFGGKATKQNAGLMLAATSGVVQGYLQGNSEQVANSQKQYEEQYKQFQERQAAQMKIYDELKDSYGDRPDADFKAWQMAHQMTDDDLKMTQDRLNAQEHMLTAAQELAKTNEQLQDQDYFKRAELDLKNKQFAAAQKKAAAAGSGLTDRAQQVADQLALNGTGLPTGTRSAAARAQLLNGLANDHPELSPAEIAAQVKAGQIGMHVSQVEGAQVARREGQVAPAIAALNEPGGIYDQLQTTAKKLDFSKNEVKNNVQLAIAKGVYANPQVQDYVTSLQEARSELANVLSRGGNVTDVNKAQAADALPAVADYPTLKTAIDRSRSVANAINAGNDSVIKAIANGQSVTSAYQYAQPAKGAKSAAAVSAYAKKYGISQDDARKAIIAAGYTVQ